MPRRSSAWRNLYFDLRDQTGNLAFAQLAASYYEQYLEIVPDDVEARTDLAASYFYSGQHRRRRSRRSAGSSRAIPITLQANYNLGIFYWRGREDYAGAASQFRHVVELAGSSDEPHAALIGEQAAAALADVTEEAKAAGQPIPEEETL